MHTYAVYSQKKGRKTYEFIPKSSILDGLDVGGEGEKEKGEMLWGKMAKKRMK